MKVTDILAISKHSVTVKQGNHTIENVDTNNDLIAPFVFTSNVSSIKVEEDRYGNYVLVLNIKEK